jgi:ATP/ADP translocase
VTSDQQPEQSASGASESTGESAGESVVDKSTVTVRRSPRFFNFMLLGAVIGVIAALVLTVVFPENPEFGAAQVFGFLLLAFVTLGVTLGAVVAIVIDRLISRRGKTVIVDRMAALGPNDSEAPDAVADSSNSDRD